MKKSHQSASFLTITNTDDNEAPFVIVQYVKAGYLGETDGSGLTKEEALETIKDFLGVGDEDEVYPEHPIVS